MRVALIGFMGAGKTTIGRLLAERLDVNFVDLDDWILANSKCSSINEIFEKEGESGFRELESNALINLINDDLVLSPGGGIVENDSNRMKLIESDFKIVYLQVTFDEAVKRLKNDCSRPLFSDPEQAMLRYKKRVPLYEECTDISIDTDNVPPHEIVNSILLKLGL